MRNTNGRNDCSCNNLSKTKTDSSESKISSFLNSSEGKFLDFVKFHGVEEFVVSLKMIHDFALYHTDVVFDTDEKRALFCLKILWEGFESLE